jgi:hypothetical protein
MLTSLMPTSRAVFTIAARLSSGKGTPFLVRSAPHFGLRFVRNQHEISTCVRFGSVALYF